MEVKWIKLTTNMLANSKIVHLRSLKNGDKLFAVWVCLLLQAGCSNMGGKLMMTEDIPYDLELLSKKLGFSVKSLELALELFVRLNMIVVEDGVFIIKNWEKYQNVDGMERIRESRRLAQARWRAKRKASTVDSTKIENNNAEEEGETEIEKELEFHSINQAAASGFEDDFVENFVENPIENRRREFLNGELGRGVVMLSNEQFDDLLDRLSLEEFEKYMAVVRDMELQGKHYKKKTHYQAILDMAEKDRAIR